MNYLYYGDNLDVLRRFGAAMAVILSCSQCLADDKAFGPRELAALVKPCVPLGWSISVKDEEVVLERGERIAIYNSIAMPPSGHEEEIRRRMRRDKLTITLRLELQMGQKEYERIANENKAATEKARKEAGGIKFMANSRFWRDHPHYNYRELPSFDLGHHSVVVTCEPEAVVFVGRRRKLHYLWMFKDAKVEEECQGILDDLGKLWRTYLRPAPQI